MSSGQSLDEDPFLNPLMQDDHIELTPDQLSALVNTRRDPDVLSHNLLSVIVSDRTVPIPTSSNPSSLTSNAYNAFASMVEWAAFLTSLWRSDDPDATFEPSVTDVETADFLPYLRRHINEYNKYKNAVERQTSRHGKGIDAAAERAAFRAASIGGDSDSASPQHDMEELVVLTRPRAKDMMEAERHLELTLATVPRMFFASEYDFTNPDTFLGVTEMPGIIQSIVRPELPIKLGQHLDMVELSLCKQVSVRAGAFYRAQASLRESHGRVKVVATQIKRLRRELASIRNRSVVQPLQLARLQRRMHNLRQVKEVMELVVEVQATKEVIIEMLNVHEFHGALDVVENTRSIVNSKLARIRGLATYRRQLEEYEDLIVRTMASRLEVAAVGYHPDDPNGETNLNNELKPLVSGLLRTHKLEYVLMEQRKRMEAEILNVGKTVVRTYLSTSYGMGEDDVDRSRAEEERSSSRSGSSGMLEQEEDQDWKNASERLKELNADQFISFLELLFEHFLVVIVQSTTVHKFLITALDLSVVTKTQNELAAEAGAVANEEAITKAEAEAETQTQANSATKHTQNESRQPNGGRRPSMKGVSTTTVITQKEQQDLQGSSLEVVTATCTKAEKSIAGVLSKRKEKHLKMNIQQMKMLWDTCYRFANKCEKKSGDRMVCYRLRGVLLEQAQDLLIAMHERNKATLNRVLDREKWKQLDVTWRIQQKLNHIQNNSHDAANGTRRRGSRGGGDSGGNGGSGSNHVREAGTPSSSKHALFDDKQYFVVGSMQTLITLIDEYLHCSRQFPSLSHKVCNIMMEMMTMFNQRTKKLVLKAGARDSAAKLPSITIKHLAVASQCIELTSSLMPSLRLALASYMQPKYHSLLNGMEKITKAYSDHREQLFQKFVSLIEDEVDQAFHNGGVAEAGPPIDTLSWDEKVEEEETTLNGSSAMRYFLKKIKLLHKALSRYLPPEQLQDVFARIISSINTKFPKVYANVQPLTDHGKQRVCNEIRVLLDVLRSLPGLREPGNSLQIHFRSRFGVAASQLL